MKLLLSLSILPLATGQGMGNGISKNTYSVTEASDAFDWIATYLPVGCFDDMCTGYDGCAHLGRSQLCLSTADCDATLSTGAKLSWADRFAQFAKKTSKPTSRTAAAAAGGAKRSLLQGPDDDHSGPPGDDDHSGPPGDDDHGGPPGSGGGFGIHCINSTDHPFLDDLSTEMVEGHFTSKMASAYFNQTYDAFMDFSLVLYASELDTYVAKFDAAGEPYLPVSWTGESGTPYFSLLKQVPGTQVVFELVSPSEPTLNAGALGNATSLSWVADNLVRVSDAAFTDNAASSTADGVLTPITVSKGCSNLTEVTTYYETVLQATESLTSSSVTGTEYASLASFKLPGAAVQIRFVERSPGSTSTDFSVAEWEAKKLASYRALATDPACGFSKWYDNHFSWDNGGVPMETVVGGLGAGGWPYHQWLEPSSNIYAADPTGDAIQVDAVWNDCAANEWCAIAEGNALADNCVQGNCMQAATDACVASVASLCPSTEDSACMDCVHLNWAVVTNQLGCTIADTAYHCTGY